MSSADDLARRVEAQIRREAIDACGLCDDRGWITGRRRGDDGVIRDAAWRCDHTDRPLPERFIPDPRGSR